MEEWQAWLILVGFFALLIVATTHIIVDGNKHFVDAGLQECTVMGSSSHMWQKECQFGGEYK